MIDRRSFHKALLCGAAALAPAGRLLSGQAQTAGGTDGPRFSVMLWTLPGKLSFAQQLQIVADAGYSGVEVGREYVTWTPAEWKRNLEVQRRLNLVIDAAVPGRNALADRSQRPALLADLKKAMPGAKELGCRQFIYTAYTRVPGQSAEERRAATADSLRYAADVVQPDGVEILLEPIDLLEYAKEAVPDVNEAFEIVRRVGRPSVKVLYDFYHEQRQAGNLLEKLAGNLDLIGLVHVADVPGRHQPGTGEINYANLYRELARLKYSRRICMEFQANGDVVPALRQAREQAIAAMAGA